MWFFILFSGFASAQGAGFSDVKMSAPSHVVQVDSTPTRGKLALENAIRSLGFQTKDVEVIEIDFTEGIDAPADSLALRRHQSWSEQFGQSELIVQHRRMNDNAVTSKQRTTKRKRKKTSELCTMTPVSDSRDVNLSTFGVLTPRDVPTALDVLPSENHTLYYLTNSEKRTMFTQLAPGESVKVVELIDGPAKQPKRRVEVKRGKSRVSVTETNTHQTVCVSPNEVP